MALWPSNIGENSFKSIWIPMDDAMWKRHFQTIGFWGSPRGGWYSGRVAAALQGVSWHQIFCLLFSSKLIFKSSKMLCIHRVTEQEMGGFHLDSKVVEKIPKLVSWFGENPKVGQPCQLQKVVPHCVTQAMPRRSWTRCALCASIPLKGETGRCWRCWRGCRML